MNRADAHSQRVVGDLTPEEFRQNLRGIGIGVAIGPFDACIRARVRGLEAPLYSLYRDYPLLSPESVFSFHVFLYERRRYGLVGKRMVRFSVDGRKPHDDLPVEQALAVLEWGINLVIALRAHSYVMLHAAVVERGGRALVMPASPGDGKTTLCTGLVHNGWRLFSDEFGLIDPETCNFVPIPRPMALKDESIQVIRLFAPGAELGPIIPDTRKGTVSHVKPPSHSVRGAKETARAGSVVFPKWEAGASLELQEIPRSDGFMALAGNAFNYELRGEVGFGSLADVIDSTRCFNLVYSDLAEAVDALTKLADDGIL